MSTSCQEIRMKLGELLDGELAGPSRQVMEAHLAACPACRQEAARLESLVRRIGYSPAPEAPAGLWMAIERRLDAPFAGHAPAPAAWRPPALRARILRLAGRPLAAAAAVFLVVGLGWLAVNAPSRAVAAEIDFRPLLARADGDVGTGIQALMRAYGGRSISADEAAQRMKVRIAAPDELPDGLRLEGRYLLQMGPSHEALALHYTGPNDGHLLLLQCPPRIAKDYGGHECMPCSAGDHAGEGVHVGKLHLMHMASDNACVCIVSTLDMPTFDAALDAVAIEL